MPYVAYLVLVKCTLLAQGDLQIKSGALEIRSF